MGQKNVLAKSSPTSIAYKNIILMLRERPCSKNYLTEQTGIAWGSTHKWITILHRAKLVFVYSYARKHKHWIANYIWCDKASADVEKPKSYTAEERALRNLERKKLLRKHKNWASTLQQGA